jgi:Spy/CpxP family protein refolding chaperone
MMKTRLSIFTVACLVFATAAFAQERGTQRNQTFTERYGQQLGLTDTQKTTIDDLDKKFQEKNATFLESYAKTMAEYREARQANDTAKVDALKPKVDSMRTEMMKIRSAHEDRIAATFTDAQKAQWSKIKEEREARMKERAQRQ